MLLKLWATYGTNFSKRKIHGALECNLIFLAWQLRGSARYKSILKQMSSYRQTIYPMKLKSILSLIEYLGWSTEVLGGFLPTPCRYLQTFALKVSKIIDLLGFSSFLLY